MSAMLQEIFYWLFNMSITAAITGTVVLLIRRIPGLPKRLTVFLWLVPFLRMVVPLGLSSPFSLMSLLSRITIKTVVVYQPAEDVSFSMINSVMAADSYFPITYKVNVLEQVFRAASVLWILVFSAILLVLAVLYTATLREMKRARLLWDNIYLSEKVASPAVYGVVRPRIVLPASFADRDTELVLAHERMHIRRGDNFWRILAFLTTAVHWFNPLAWVFLKQFLADLELSCDERVLVQLGQDRAKEYALTLLKSKESTAAFTSAFGGAKIWDRIENILSFKKMTRLSLIVFLVLIIAIFYCLLTNAG